MMVKKLKAKIKCKCEDHYLELCLSFDGNKYIYQRHCYKCGNTWRYTKYISNNIDDSYINNYINKVVGSDGNIITVPRMEMTENTILFLDGTQYCYVYARNIDGTCGDLIRLVNY